MFHFLSKILEEEHYNYCYLKELVSWLWAYDHWNSLCLYANSEISSEAYFSDLSVHGTTHVSRLGFPVVLLLYESEIKHFAC